MSGRLTDERLANIHHRLARRSYTPRTQAEIEELLAELVRLRQRETDLVGAEADLRREWWLNHGCDYPAMYGDDGEMQCANGRPFHLPLDFKRQPLDELRKAVRHARLARAAVPVPEPERPA